MPKISVIVPVYNVEQYLHKCVDSILAQTFTDFELILVDDGSPDNCGKICDEYAEKDSRVTVIHQKNGGLSAARNTGIDWAMLNSNSEWILFVDSDDWISPICLEKLYYTCIKCQVLVAIGGYSSNYDDIINENKTIMPEILKTDEIYGKSPVTKYSIVSAWCKLYFKTLLNDIRYPVGKVCEDRFTTHLILFKTEKVACITEPLYYYTIRKESISNCEWNPRMLDDLEACERQLKYFKENNHPIAYKRTYSFYFCRIPIFIREIRDTNYSKYKNYYSYLNKLLRKKLKEYKTLLPKDAGLMSYRIAYYDKKRPLTVAYYFFYMLIIYGPKKTINKIRNRKRTY